MISRLVFLLRRANQILQIEGLVPLVRRGFSFVAGRIFRYETYYLYEYATENVQKLNEADYMPRIDDFTLKVVSSNQESDRLETEGLEFRSQVANARKRLEKGAVAFCIFAGSELISITWCALTQKAKDSFYEPPYNVEFSKGEACGGNGWTHPQYRHMGLLMYIGFKTREFLMENGITKYRSAWPKENIASLKSYAKFGPKRIAEARYLKILWWKWWKEKPLT